MVHSLNYLVIKLVEQMGFEPMSWIEFKNHLHVYLKFSNFNKIFDFICFKRYQKTLYFDFIKLSKISLTSVFLFPSYTVIRASSAIGLVTNLSAKDVGMDMMSSAFSPFKIVYLRVINHFVDNVVHADSLFRYTIYCHSAPISKN